MKLYDTGVYIADGTQIVADDQEAAAKLASLGKKADKASAAQGTMAYGILKSHNTSDNMHELRIKFDKLTSHDITYVGIIQTARASGLEKFPIPYVLT
ncbi:MAG: hydratase, partial [Candidatus Weimeria sp.]